MKRKSKEPETMEEFHAAALASLSLASHAYSELKKYKKWQTVPESLNKDLSFFIGRACRYWFEFEKYFQVKLVDDLGKDAHDYGGIHGETHVVDKIHVGKFGKSSLWGKT